MKKLFVVLSSLALATATGYAQHMGGDGSGEPGPHGQHAGMDLSTMEGVPQEVVDAYNANVAAREALQAERQAVIDQLGENATDDAVRAALEQWRITNEEQIAEIRQNAEIVREWFRSQREDRPALDQNQWMHQRRQEFRTNVETMRQAQTQLRQQLQDPTLTEEQRRELVQAFREENRETVQKLKLLQRQRRLGQGDGGGDRRQGPGE